MMHTTSGKTVHCVIPARYASTRLPGKPLIDLGGKQMVMRSYDCIRRVFEPQDITVATDDERIANVCDKNGVQYEMTKRCRTGTDRVAEVASRHPEIDIWVVGMGDNPLLPQGVVAPILQGLTRSDSATLGLALINTFAEAKDTTTHKLVTNTSGSVLYVSRSMIPYSADAEAVYYKMVNVYAIWADQLKIFAALPTGPLEQRESLEILRFIEHGFSVRAIAVPGGGYSIDVPEDVERAKLINWCDEGSPA